VLYLVGFRFLVSVIVAPFEVLQPVVRVVFGPLWMICAAQAFFDRGWIGTIWRIVLAYFMHMIATALLLGAIAIPWVLV
jgi:hypothetical protein